MFKRCDKLNVLEEVIIFIAQAKSLDYELHDYVYKIIETDSGFANVVLGSLFNQNDNVSCEILSCIWEQQKSFELADLFFDSAIQSQTSIYLSYYKIEPIFLSEDSNCKNNINFLQWALIKINKINDDVSIRLLTELVSKCNGNLTYEYYVKLIKKRISLVFFKEIICYPSSFSWSGSEVNVYIAKIDKFEKILSLIPPEIDYLEYKSIVEDYIENFKKNISKIRINEKLNFDDSLCK